MVYIDLWRLTMAALCMITVATSSSVDVPAQQEGGLAGEDAPAALEAPAGDQATSDKRDEKRSGHHCVVGGYVFQHGEVFSYPGYSHCIKYRCNNGGYRMVQSACERNSQCVPVGSVISDRCRSLRCVREDRGNMYYYRMEPTANDQCDAEGKCVPKNQPFQHSDCNKYQCMSTANGGYTFRLIAAQCKDDYGQCAAVGQRFSKWVNGHWYHNCVCLHGGGYSCRG